MKNKFTSIIVATLLVASMGTTAFAADPENKALTDAQIDSIYSSYYYEMPTTYAVSSEDNVIDMSSFAEMNSVDIDISTKEGQNEFLTLYEEVGSLAQMAKPTNLYYALCDQSRWGKGTAIINEDGSIKQVYVGDNGDAYNLVLDDNLKAQIESSELNPDTTVAMFVGIPMYAEGILFTDGEAEYYMPKLIRGGELHTNKLYSVSEVMADINVNSENILYNEVVLTDEYLSDDGRMNPPTGGGTVNQAEDNSASVMQLSSFAGILILSTISTVYFTRKLKEASIA